ncbi:MAG: VanZ family protein [Clostridia bacterium]|nr:VanZ family protein [Clostridia bacterium]
MHFSFSRRTAAWLCLTGLWMVVIFLFSAQNADDSSDTSGRVLSFLCGLFGYVPTEDLKETLSFLVRKAAHMTEFGILGVLWLRTLRESFGDFYWRYPAAFILASVYAATDEYHQLFVEGRAGQVTDWLIDSAGIWLWLTAAWILMKITHRDNISEYNGL